MLGGAASASPEQFKQMQINRAQAQQARQQAVQQQLQEGSARLAHAQVENQVLQNQWDNMPKDFQDTLLRQSQVAGQQLKDAGTQPVLSGLTEDSAKQYLQHVYDANPNQASHYVMHADGDGSFDVFKIADPNALNQKEMEVTTAFTPSKNEDGSLDFSNPTPQTVTMAPGTVKVADAQAAPVVAAKNYWTAFNTNQAKIQVANQTGVSAKNEAAANKANAAATAGPKPENLLFGSLPDGSQVAGTADELKQAGAAGINKLPTTEGAKVVVARQLIAPNGLFNQVAADISKLQSENKLGVAASRFGDFMAGKVGTDPDFASLRTHMGLLSTALMQAHVGARGSEQMLEHFKNLADYRISDPATLKSALAAEWNYVNEKAMLPKGGK